MKWLAPPDPSTNFNKAREQYRQGAGQWLLESDAYSTWNTNPNSFLWLHSLSRCGKTIMSSTIIADLENNAASSWSLLYFYFDFNEVDKRPLRKAVPHEDE
ncbi:hypothetical protein DL764_006608 [Monosporascus ibericus]|uniref:Nephrocystin 3-like N-terminal domain-containing protein n=1 Tax=Monosporascus ibericus TaxID=155417 RepID=A0A4Q4T6R0_9PEZI|nr:hypothetical protein DL764_006608 [Monosporascus ibericus]